VLRPAILVGDVETWLDGDAVARFEWRSPAIAWDIMNVETDIVSDVVGEEAVDVARADVETKGLELLMQAGCCLVVDVVQGDIGILAAEGDAPALNSEYGLVQVTLGWSEAPIDRPCARDVGDVCAILTTGVNEHEVAVVKDVVVEDIMDAHAIAAATDDGYVCRSVASVGDEAVVQKGVKVLLPGPRTAHGFRDGTAGDLAGTAHVGDLGGRLDGPQIVEKRIEGEAGRRPPRRRVGLEARPDAAGAGVRTVKVGVDTRGLGQDIGQDRGDAGDVRGQVCVEDVLGGADAVARATPLLGRGVLGETVELEGEVTPVLARVLDDGERVRLVPAGQVEEVGFLAEGVEDGAGPVLEVGRGENGYGTDG
jgi:hypothetical protein